MRTCVSYADFSTRNGSVIFRVKDKYGPMITIHSTCGKNQRMRSEFYVTKETLKDLAKCFNEASEYEYKTNPHHNQGSPPGCLMQGDIDEYGDVDTFGMFSGEGTATNAPTFTDRGYDLTKTLIIDDCSIPGQSIVPGTATGSVYRLGKEIQKFTVAKDGVMTFTKIHYPIVYLVKGVVNQELCTIDVTWNDLPGENYLTFDFEFYVRSEKYE